ncbi:MAG TPA: NADP-dependent succinic semialdehyde dehydrogenase [Bacteroidetes bacterium]|nr:NADP-dependent succinic semialdehyde dehydrogenase [Bacteroidota bacterium]
MNFYSINPTTEQTVAEFTAHTPPEVRQMLSAAAAAQGLWARRSLIERVRRIDGLADVLERRRQEGARTITQEMGKPLAQALAEVDKCAGVCRYMASIAPTVLADESVDAGFRHSRVVYEPLGLVLSIMPWNFPLWQFFRFAAPALLAGNGVLLKHAPSTMGSGLFAESVCLEAGLPAGLVTSLLIDVPEVESVIADPAVAAVTFTGSTGGGRAVAQVAARHIKPVVLELGGSDAYIVLADADLDVAVSACVAGRLLNAGQSCIGAKRFIVHASLHDAFVARVAESFDAAVVGSPLDPDTQVGPLARQDLRDTLLDQVRRALDAGARCVTKRTLADVPSKGWFVPPMLLVDVHEDNPAFREELFGPVASVTTFTTEEQAIALANNTDFGLGNAVFSRDASAALRIAAQLQSGTVFINDFVRSHAALPFGGVKASGYGRELGRWGMLEFVNVKNITIG